MLAKNTKLIALLGIMGATFFVALYLETIIVSIIPILKNVPPAVVSLPIIFTFMLVKDFKVALLGGAVFGIASVMVAFMVGNPVFIQPQISILPRLFVGLIAYIVYISVKKLTDKSKKEFISKYLAYAVGAAAGILSNTVLVVTCLALWDFSGFALIFQTIISFNFLFEFLAAVIIVPILANSISKFIKK